MKIYLTEINAYDSDAIFSFLQRTAGESGLSKKLKGIKRILLKPNLLGPYPPEKAVTTHPAVVEAIIRLCLDAGKEVVIGDSPGGTYPVAETLRKTGILTLAQKYDLKILNFSNSGVTIHNRGKHIVYLTDQLEKVDGLINIAKYKTHSLMYYTGAVKNLYGLIPGLKKSDYHGLNPDFESFTDLLTTLYSLVREKILFNIIDGIWGMEGDGPSAGIPRNFGVIFAGEKASALDYIASGMMGFREDQMQYVNRCLAIDNILPAEIEMPLKWSGFVFDHVKIKKVSNLVKFLASSPQFLKNIFRRSFRFYPDFTDNCRLCGVCEKSCPVNAITISKNASKPVLNEARCIKCLCCHELCPYGAVYIKKSFLAKLLVK